ncbi:GTPase Era [Paenibacillus plantiphilus]|uniref:GTPase Era n=1 Tax=Paenibacillus plantiphilus TaxID=2905650 RepID=A0ABN8G0B4_9BACL|nr:dynamin family protein [Paenibacillus plantiphilus]CAH1195947.1 GTPase Era [Paenibacillus plantiphilus]
MSHTMETAPHPLDTALEEIAPIMKAAGDDPNSARLLELRSKLAGGQLTVAFCGHFSAGKSTLINRLCGTELLPSSPIPTSANVVTIMSGESKARITKLVSGKVETLEVPIADVNRYCKDGENVQSVTLSTPIPRLGDHTVLLDTPGIDSTDDAHRMSTESALHMADVVFYVMDYNHVQSEINFTFAKQLKEWGKPLYLIVNQIDKHRDHELSFAEYRRSVEEAFANWQLEPNGIVYLSLREPNHPQSEWGELERLLEELSVLRAPLALCSVDASTRHLVRAHGKAMEEASESEREALLDEAGGESGAEQVRAEIGALEGKLAEAGAEIDGLRTRLRLEMQSLLDNANITPAATRDLAHAFLESRKPGFKAGLLFAAAKTAAEQQRRLEAFREDMAAQVKAGIEWHLNDLLRKAADAIGWRDESLERKLEADIHWEIEPEYMVSHVKAGAVFGNEYTIVYCRELAADVKALFRKRAMSWIETLADRAAAAGAAAAAPLRARLGELASQAAALAKLASLAEREAAHLARLAALLPPAPPRPALPQPQAAGRGAEAPPGAAAEARGAEAAAAAAVSGAGIAHAPLAAAAAAAAPQSDNSALGPQREAAERLRRAAELLSPHPSLASAVAAMRDKGDRLRLSRFTIALFGAFSAGKSSLANALLGESVLPVSPNPTTAAVNRIVPPTRERPSGTATVLMKTREAMLDDLRYSLRLLGEDTDTMSDEAVLESIEKLTPAAVHAGGRPHYSFLKAAFKGWREHEPLLGQQLNVDGGQYRSYVAEESRSCFVSEIELYHYNALTAQGIVLVDTPGADSVNARHTGVAFNYIKNADAILFVTYYNHAFSQADRQFLLQLGRVKDQFELDKMFFIVNAADLASSEEERQGVLDHVERNLQQHGIRFPRMFPISSLQALDGKRIGDEAMLHESGLPAFESSFIGFARNDLGKLAVASAEQELERARRTIEGWLEAASGDAATREAERTRLVADADRARMIAEGVQPGNPQLEQELKELLFYVVQRVQFRFGDHYNFAFNPSSLQDDGRDLKKALWTSWLELQRLLQIELAQELEATSLRLDHTLNRLAAKRLGDTSEELANVLEGFRPSSYHPLDIATPEQGEPWHADTVESKWLWSRFKSPRHFFEGDGKIALRGALEAELAGPIQSWVTSIQEEWSSRYEQLWNQAVANSNANLLQEINAFTEGKLSSLSGDADVAELRHLSAALADI